MNMEKHIRPLADRMRPKTLEEFFGQDEAVGEQSFLRKAIESDSVPSLILWGPPGVGKTTLAKIIAHETKADFVELSATSSGKKMLLEVVDRARSSFRLGKTTIVFIDEIHRWNKAQQDALLPSVEEGVVTLIGATTENPSFEVNSALLSRSRVITLRQLKQKELIAILERAFTDRENGLGKKILKSHNEIFSCITSVSNGDARFALGILEQVSNQSKKFTIEDVKNIVQKSHLLYDKNGEEHYNIISALHKSMRGGDADASVYWVCRMLEGGEDPQYIARRMIRFASEDIGLANNSALILANTVFDVCHKLGMPESGVHLAHCAIYLAKSPKSITAYEAYEKAKRDVEVYGNLPVPLHIRNAPTKLMKDLDYGKGYKYTPREDSDNQKYFPEKLQGRRYMP
jgi:putative ATPase